MNVDMPKRYQIPVLLAAVFSIVSLPYAQSTDPSLPHLVHENGRYALIVDGKPFFMLGGQAHNSSGWPVMMPEVWAAIDGMHANTLEIPIYWQQIEPQEGTFNFSVVDTIIGQARKHDVRLVLLWFATWKNSNTDYTPDWMKLDPKKYPHVVGRDGRTVLSASPFGKATMDADAKAFTAVMKHLKKIDPEHTVIMMQVENEAGTYRSVRDYSPAAQKIFQGPVPAELLKPEVLKALHRPASAKGTWQEVFGSDADEYFHAWSVASYINDVAAAGKAVYPLPMYVNVSLRDPMMNTPASTYESGGATDNVIPIWKVAAPSIDLIAPDIYLPKEQAMKVMELYDRPDNVLFVPESLSSADYLYEVLRRSGIGFSPFGVDREELMASGQADAAPYLAPLATQYAMLRLADGELAKWIFEGRSHVVEVSEKDTQRVDLGIWRATVTYNTGRRWTAPPASQPEPAVGRALTAQLGENEFVVLATQSRVAFEPGGANRGKPWQFLKVEEGRYEHGSFKFLRLLNGDEVGWGTVSTGAEPALLRITMTAW